LRSRAPSQLEGYNTQNMFIYVDDVMEIWNSIQHRCTAE
jgi:hypothetical protein